MIAMSIYGYNNMTDKQKLQDLLNKTDSKKRVESILRWLRQEPQRVGFLVELLLENEERIAEKAAWVMGYLGTARKVDILPYLPQLIRHLHKPGLHNGIRRGITRMLMYVKLPEQLHGELMDISLAMLEDPKEFIAVRANCISILERLAKFYPGIIPEIYLVLETRMDDAEGRVPAALAARVKQFRRKTYRLK